MVHLEQALEQQDAQALTILIHQLAGSSGSYGFGVISESCSEIKYLLDDHDSIDSNTQEKTQQLIRLMADQIKGVG